MRVALPNLVVIAFVLTNVNVCRAASKFDGTWRGTYNSQPTELQPDGTFPEAVNQFKLRLQQTNASLTGEFQRLGGGAGAPQQIKNGRLFGNRGCFDVIVEGSDMRWCVLVRENRLLGSWSNGPEGGPLLEGAGVGARLFKVEGQRLEAEGAVKKVK